VIAIRYELDVSEFELMERSRFCTHDQIGPGAHSFSCTIGTGALFLGPTAAVYLLTSHSLLALKLSVGTAVRVLPYSASNGLSRDYL